MAWNPWATRKREISRSGYKFTSADDLSHTLGSNAIEWMTLRQSLSQPGTILPAPLDLFPQAGASHPMAQLSFLQHPAWLWAPSANPELGIPEQLPLQTLKKTKPGGFAGLLGSYEIKSYVWSFSDGSSSQVKKRKVP